jgi:hypothetical protein
MARYRADNDEKSPEEDQSWMDYLKSQSKGNPISDAMADMVEHGKSSGPDQCEYNPYDYEDPSEKPKDPKGPPFVSKVPPENDYGLFETPKIFKERGELEEWLQAQGQDMTNIEEDQSPAMSLTCKYASVQNVIAKYMLSFLMPIVIPEEEFGDLFRMTRVAASLGDIVDKDFHYKNDAKMQRAEAVNAVWMNKNNPKQRETGLFIFRVSSPGSELGAHTVYLQFLRGEEEKHYPSYAEYPVQLACTCPSFLFHGAQYYAVHDSYMYMPAFKPDDVAPKAQNIYVMHASPAYPKGRRYPGRGLNSRVCKHLLKVYELLGKLKIEAVYRKYPISGPPSKVINTDVWKDLMKFDFTEANIKQRLRADKVQVPAFFRREEITQSVINWFNDVWIPRTDDEKIKTLNDMVMYPEKIFFILVKEAYLKRSRGDKISDKLIDEGYKLMAQVVKEPEEETPQDVKMEHIPDSMVGKGTGPLDPTAPATPGVGTVPADKYIQEPEVVEPATKAVPSELAPTTLRKKRTPEERKEEERKKLRERGLSDSARRALKRFQDETVEPRKEKLRQVGKRPFLEE